VSDLGIGIGAPRDYEIGHFAPGEKQRVGNHDPRHGVGGVSEFVARANVAAA